MEKHLQRPKMVQQFGKERDTLIHMFRRMRVLPSINEKRLSKALDFANKYRRITNHERDIILHAKRSLLFSDNCPWENKSADNQFDVTMGSFDGAETCELVGCYLLSLLTKKYGQNIGLY